MTQTDTDETVIEHVERSFRLFNDVVTLAIIAVVIIVAEGLRFLARKALGQQYKPQAVRIAKEATDDE